MNLSPKFSLDQPEKIYTKTENKKDKELKDFLAKVDFAQLKLIFENYLQKSGKNPQELNLPFARVSTWDSGVRVL